VLFEQAYDVRAFLAGARQRGLNAGRFAHYERTPLS
jgi:hypothetical protein